MRNLRLASATAANYCDTFTLECTAFGTVLDVLAEEEAEDIRADLGVAIASTRGLFAKARDNYVALSKVRGEGARAALDSRVGSSVVAKGAGRMMGE